jgi:methionyl-tRNA formyltransferase
VYAKAAPLAVELLDEVLAAWPQVDFRPQPEQGVTYAGKLGPADRELDWSRPPDEIVNRVRALSPHIGARGVVRGRTLTVWKAGPAGPEAALVEDGVELVEVQPEGRRRMTGAEYLRGLRA